MKKRTGFLFWLLAGGVAAVLAFKHLDPAKREKLIDRFDDQVDQFKNHAVDYIFYANDAVDSASNHFHHQASQAVKGAHATLGRTKNHVNHLKTKLNHSNSGHHFKTAASHLHSVLNASKNDSDHDDDIVINANDTLKMSNHQTVVFYPDGDTKPLD